MNSLLASALSALNAIFALIIILAGVFFGFGYSRSALIDPSIGITIGAIGGIVVAVLTCGIIALLARIEEHLKEIAHELRSARYRSIKDVTD
ncbi:hypothetical protein ACUSIJ_25050 [Pseudochelatococcus sp. B33]